MDLSADQKEKVDYFKEITSYEEEDHEKVVQLLRSTQWNLEIAVPRYFDGNFADDEATLGPPESSQSSEMYDSFATGAEQTENMGNVHSRRRASTPQVQRLISPSVFDYEDAVPKFPKAIAISDNWKFKLGLPPRVSEPSFNPLVSILLLIPRTLLLILTGISNIVDFLFPGFNRMIGLFKDSGSFPSEPFFNEVQPNFQSFFDNLISYNKESETDNSRRLIFQEGEYNQAYDFAKNNLKWFIIVLLSSDTKQGLQTLAEGTHFRKFNDKNDVILWGGNVDYIEPFEVGKSYRVRKLPQLLLVANVSKTGDYPLMSVVSKHTVPLECSQDQAKQLMKRLQRSIDMYEPQLVSQRYDKREQELSRRLRQEQDDAYNKSLLADKVKMEAKLEQKRIEEEEHMKDTLKEEEKIRKIKLKESFLVLKSIEMLEAAESDSFEKGNHTAIQFRLNTGERIVQKFLSTKTVYDIFLFIECKLFLKTFDEDIKDEHELLDTLKLERLQEIQDISEYEHEFKFQLIRPIPRFTLAPDASKKVADVKEIWPNGNLLVEFDADDEDDDESDIDEDEN